MHSDIVCISETWLDSSIPDNAVEIPDYSIHRNDRNRHGGGVAVYVTNGLTVKRRPDLEHYDCESVWLEIITERKCLLLGTYYRPPISQGNRNNIVDSFTVKLHATLLTAIATNPDCLLVVGDFNDRCRQWDDGHSNSEMGLKLFDLINIYNLTQVITEPTRYDINAQYILDLMITDAPGLLSKVSVTPPIANLDHCIISCSLAFNFIHEKAYSRKIWDYEKGNYEGLNATLRNNMNTIILYEPTIDTMVDKFNSVLLECASYFIPNRTITVRPRDKPYITHECRRADRIRNRWHKIFQRTRSPLHYDIFRERRREAKQMRQVAKIDCHNRLMAKLSGDHIHPKDYWKTIKSVMGVKVKPTIGTLTVNGNEIANTKNKADIFNNYFATQSTLDDTPRAMPPLLMTTRHRLGNVKTTQAEVERIIHALDISKANGPDLISARLIKSTGAVIGGTISRLFNLSFETGKVPKAWKEANITPVYKKGERHIVTNYRPISLLSIVGKVQEKVVFKALYDFCHKHMLLTWRNSGFKPKDSATNQLHIVTHQIYNALEHGNDVNIAFLDISKAFDRVWHIGLLHKLRTLGVCGTLIDWLSDYLTCRKQRVVINGTSSDWILIKAGVPQGSILGPLLFLIYVNDIIYDIRSDIFLYADDTILMRVVTDPLEDTRIMNNDLELLNAWSKQWAVTFSPAKSHQLIVTRKMAKLNYAKLQLDGTDIKRVQSHRHLGMIFTENFSWEDHIRDRVSKASPTLNTLVRCSRIIPRIVKENIYKTFIRPILEYGCTIYDNCPIYVSNYLERTQRSAALACTGAYKDTSHAELLHELAWPPLTIRRNYHKLCQLHQIVYGTCPSYLSELLPLERPEGPYQLRHVNKLKLPRMRTVSYGKSFLPSTIRLWNALTTHIRSCASRNTFKEALKRDLFPKPNRLFSYGSGEGPINHARLRMGLSALNQHRWKYNYIRDTTCPSCNHKQEGSVHFFLECPTYRASRYNLLQSVNLFVGDILPDIDHIQTRRAKEALINILLRGDDRLDGATNRAIFDSVQNYIISTKRMTRS
jgi:hypothetical protein